MTRAVSRAHARFRRVSLSLRSRRARDGVVIHIQNRSKPVFSLDDVDARDDVVPRVDAPSRPAPPAAWRANAAAARTNVAARDSARPRARADHRTRRRWRWRPRARRRRRGATSGTRGTRYDVPDVDARERRDGRARGDNAREDDVTREGCAAPCARAGVVNIGTRVEECGGEAAAARARRGERRDASKNRDAFDGGTRAKRRDRPRLTDDDDRSVDDVRSRFVIQFNSRVARARARFHSSGVRRAAFPRPIPPSARSTLATPPPPRTRDRLVARALEPRELATRAPPPTPLGRANRLLRRHPSPLARDVAHRRARA